ncbi:MAG: chorismate synthase [Bacteroidia bacterium]|nr:chorismate synthase [Bacteroidia bacterium]NNJ56345.1 chorismate synthase [Bacteroidia bacterium]
MNTLGKNIRLTSYGESHGEVIGAVLDGMPSNFEIDLEFIQMQLNRRRPGQSAITTTRNESDELIVNSGIFDGKTTGAPIHLQIPNTNHNPKDYSHLKDVLRPSHADYTYQAKYGIRDYKGGGRSSARITAGWVAGGALVQDFLSKQGIQIAAYVKQVGSVALDKDAQWYSMEQIDGNAVRCPDDIVANKMIEEIAKAKKENDSLGGVIECVIKGVKVGVGNPVFEKLNAQLAHAMFSINAVKGFEIGGGFEMSKKRGSEVNDSFGMDNEKVITHSNNSGGIQGGISNGMDIVFRVAFKPTATIGTAQQTIDTAGKDVILEVEGRHDPCVVPRAVPIVETLSALVLGDLIV